MFFLRYFSVRSQSGSIGPIVDHDFRLDGRNRTFEVGDTGRPEVVIVGHGPRLVIASPVDGVQGDVILKLSR